MSSNRFDDNLQDADKKSTDNRNVPANKSRPISHLEKTAKEYVVKKYSSPEYGSIPELEAYNSAVCQFIAGTEYVPSLNAYYGNIGYESVASKKMPDFVTNANDPLTLQDAEIECMKELILRNRIIGDAKIILTDINTDEADFNKRANISSGIINFFGVGSQNFASRRSEITNLISDLNDIRDPDVILPLLDEHAANIRNRLNNQLNLTPRQTNHLTTLLAHIKNYQDQPGLSAVNNQSIEEMENILASCKIAGVNFRNKPDSEHININGTSILAGDLRHYEYIKGLAISSTTRYLMHEGDFNNTNFAKDGRMVDFGMTKLKMQYLFGTMKRVDEFTRLKHKLTLGYTERDLRHFPILKDSQPFYWPTRRTSISNILIEAVSAFLKNREEMQYLPKNLLHDKLLMVIKQALSLMHEYHQQSSSIIKRLADMAVQMVLQIRSILEWRDAEDIEAEDAEQDLFGMANLLFDRYINRHKDEYMKFEKDLREKLGVDNKMFAEKDNAVFKALASHPVFEFFKFKTIMKYMITKPDLYQSLGEMYFRKGCVYLSLLVDDENRNHDSLRDILINMPEYQKFIEEHGGFAVELIDKDFKEYADRLQRKIEKHPDESKYQNAYRALLDSVNKVRLVL